jgi:hypothetical protein
VKTEHRLAAAALACFDAWREFRLIHNLDDTLPGEVSFEAVLRWKGMGQALVNV